MAVTHWVFLGVTVLLFLLNIYQFLVQRAALRIAEILYVMSRNVRQKAAEVRRDQKDVEIIEAHLFDLATSARSLLRALGRSESELEADPVMSVAPNGHHMDSDSLMRLADNIFYAVTEEQPTANWSEVESRALNKFLKEVPNMEAEAARKIIKAVSPHFQRKSGEQLAPVSKNS